MSADAVGGVWTYAVELAGALRRRGVRTLLAVMGDPPTLAQRRQASAVPDLELVGRALRLEWMADPWDDVARAADWLVELEARVAPDVVHLNGYACGAAGFRAPRVVVG